MKSHEFTFLSADGKTPIHAVEWLPDCAPRAVVQIVHGVSEYILRYKPFAEYLTAQGFAVVGHDHLGHGESVLPGATRLYFGPKGSWDHVVQDIETLRCRTKPQFPQLPYFLLGHSMGSFLVRTHLIRYPAATDGTIIMGTGQMSPLLIAGGLAVTAVESRRVGATAASPLVNKLSFAPYNKPFAPNRTPYDWLSVNTENVDAYMADPLCGGIPSVGLFQEMLKGMRFIAQPENLQHMDPTTPILFISGGMDPVGDLSRGVRRAHESFQAAGVQDLSLKLYPNLRHEILNESERQTVYEYLLQWLTDRLT